MCTLTYLPNAQGGFIFTTNRDESPLRPTSAPVIKPFQGQQLLFPADGVAGGTWIATSELGRTACLLNGAFAPHEMGGQYRKSRGLVLLESFTYGQVEDFAGKYDFAGIEPFTIVFVQHREAVERMAELRWDGLKVYFKEVPHRVTGIWSSAQLYKPEVIAQREIWFGEWMSAHADAPEQHIHDFHRFGGQGDVYNDLRMNRGVVQTVSTTSVATVADGMEMRYWDLLADRETRMSVRFR